jgi:hypothetical protein
MRKWPLVAALLTGGAAYATLCPHDAFAQFNTPRAKAKPTRGGGGFGSSQDPLGSGEASDSELDDFSKEVDPALHSIKQGAGSLDVAFPAGGSRMLEGAAGARLVLPARLAVSLALLTGIDKKAKSSAFGGALKLQQFFSSASRAFPYAAVSLTAGKSGGDANKDDDDLKAGAGLSFGVEIFLLRELSTSAEVGVSSQIVPGDAFRLATGTSQIALHYFFGG